MPIKKPQTDYQTAREESRLRRGLPPKAPAASPSVSGAEIAGNRAVRAGEGAAEGNGLKLAGGQGGAHPAPPSGAPDENASVSGGALPAGSGPGAPVAEGETLRVRPQAAPVSPPSVGMPAADPASPPVGSTGIASQPRPEQVGMGLGGMRRGAASSTSAAKVTLNISVAQPVPGLSPSFDAIAASHGARVAMVALLKRAMTALEAELDAGAVIAPEAYQAAGGTAVTTRAVPAATVARAREIFDPHGVLSERAFARNFATTALARHFRRELAGRE